VAAIPYYESGSKIAFNRRSRNSEMELPVARDQLCFVYV